LTQTTTFMGRLCAGGGPPTKSHLLAATVGTRTTHPREPALKLLLVVNSSASSVTARSRVVIQKALAADHELEVAETSRRDHATRLAQGAAAEGFDVVVALGGDGTLNEAANGLLGTDTALATLPGGSTNVFARTLGLPNDPIEATGLLLDSLAADSIRPVGVGTANGRCFLFHVGIGFDAEVVHQVERRGSIKRWAGHPLFAWCALDTWFRHYDRSRPRFAVRFGDEPGAEGPPVVDDGYFAICLNTDPYTFLGNRPFRLAPAATLDTGLSMVTLRTLSVGPLVGLAASSLTRSTGLRRGRHVDVRHDLHELVVEGHGPFPHQVDGDYLGEVDRLVLRHEPAALRLVVPPAG
jgi:diacylglycerol kinase family enzyme